VLISVESIQRDFGLTPRVVLHVGSHHGQEANAYSTAGWGTESTIWVDADDDALEVLSRRLPEPKDRHHLVKALAWDVSDLELTFYKMSDSQSSSALPPRDHIDVYPTIGIEEAVVMTSVRLDEALAHLDFDIDFVNLDVQGAELKALIGLGTRLDSVSAVYSEINRRPLYDGAPMAPELDAWLISRGFVRVDTRWVPQGWGDALWMREGHATMQTTRRLQRRIRNVAYIPKYAAHWTKWKLGLLATSGRQR
jgi:FkbM family methyltransferase